jgi:two-component system, sporulation sensor kinase E
VTDETRVPGGDEELARRLRDVAIVGAMLAVVALLHQFTNAVTPTQIALHDFYRRLYYLPILYAAFRFGSRGGIVTAAASVLLFTPHAALTLGGLLGSGIDNLFEIVMYVLMGWLFGWLRDVEERRTRDLMQVSRKLEEAYKALEERAMQLISIQDYTQSILRSVTSGVITVGPEASVATLNPSAERMLGIPEDQAVAKTIRSVFKDDGGLSIDVAKVLEGRSPRTLRDISVVTRGGKTVHAQASVSRMRDVGGRKLGAVVTIEDVSEVKALTDQLIRADRPQPSRHHPRVGPAHGGVLRQQGQGPRRRRGHQARDRQA